MNRLFVLPPNSYSELLIPSVMVSEAGLWEVMGSEPSGWANTLIGGDTRAGRLSLHHVRTQGKPGIWKPGGGSLPKSLATTAPWSQTPALQNCE